MKKIKNTESLSTKELKSINGGSMAYDIGWGLYWGFLYATSGCNDYIGLSAMMTYDAHYIINP